MEAGYCCHPPLALRRTRGIRTGPRLGRGALSSVSLPDYETKTGRGSSGGSSGGPCGTPALNLIPGLAVLPRLPWDKLSLFKSIAARCSQRIYRSLSIASLLFWEIYLRQYISSDVLHSTASQSPAIARNLSGGICLNLSRVIDHSATWLP